MVSLIETFQNHLEFPFELLGDPGAKHVGDLVRRQAKEAKFTGTLKEFSYWKILAKNEIVAVLDL